MGMSIKGIDMSVKQLRLDKGWSQEELSQLSGLSVRTIQRIEQGNKAGLESLKALACVFELQVSDLNCVGSHSNVNSPLDKQGMKKMNEEAKDNKESSSPDAKEKAVVIAQVKKIKAFNKSLVSYLGGIFLLFLINLLTSPAYFWVVWPALGWGIALVIQGLSAHEVIAFFGSDWEQKQIEKRLKKKQEEA